MKPSPAGWPRIASAVFYEDAAKAIDWLVKAFGFEVQLKIEGEGGRIEHSELVYGGGMIMVGSFKAEKPEHAHRRSPKQIAGQNTQSMGVFVDDADAHCQRATKAGAVIVMPPTTHDYGDDFWVDRTYECIDLEGHHWWFYTRVREAKAKT